MCIPKVNEAGHSVRKETQSDSRGEEKTSDWNVQGDKLYVLLEIFLWWSVRGASFARTQHRLEHTGNAGGTVHTASRCSWAPGDRGTWKGQ